MLWVYLDDSGVHDHHGTLRRYAVGGGVATSDTWQALNAEWKLRCTQDGVSWFHYKDWKRARLGYAGTAPADYAGWSTNKLDTFLSDLAAIVSNAEISYLCVSIPALTTKRAFRDSYQRAITETINRVERIQQQARHSGEVSFMISVHAELAGKRIQRYFEKLRAINHNRKECVIGDPRTNDGLQIADLIVNEMAVSRRIRAGFGPALRLPKLTPIMERLTAEDPFHPMIELHFDDDLNEWDECPKKE